MESLRTLRYRLWVLDQQRVIDIAWMQRWLIMVIFAFISILYLWDWLVAEDDPTGHFPAALLPLELRKKMPAHGFTSEEDARAFAIREIEIAVVACKRDFDKDEESAIDAVTMMKSATMMSKSVIHFHIFTEDQLYATLMRELDKWPSYIRHRVSFKFSHVTYPESLLGWRNLHQPCSAFKLFLPHVLKEIDHVLYIDSHSVFLNSLDNLWSELIRFKSDNAISLTAPSDPTNSHYSYPLSRYGIRSIDTGIILYDMFRLRHSVFQIPVSIKTMQDSNLFEFEIRNMTYHPNMLHTVYELFKSDITVPDRDIFAIISHFNPHKIHMLPCSWNFRWQYAANVLKKTRLMFLESVLSSCKDKHVPHPCDTAFLIHSCQSYTQHQHEEFLFVENAWENSGFKNSRDFILDDITSYTNHSRPISKRKYNDEFLINMRLFLKSMKYELSRN
ncbi:glucoside xylosyltransferase 1-like [Styela clava]|uniref:glucoside xylosyltransferase 1-like n=1 Tax=Styela clava TaxID=7725 RepID=UPI00193980EC|nr:glucoside xylosyltransferase 1-like [Styela clava]